MIQESKTVLPEEDLSLEEFDIDFEFDAPQFYNFTRPELESETEEIELWFELAGNYPPSPFSPKFNWKFEPPKQILNPITESKPVEISKPVIESLDTCSNHKDKYNGFIYYNQTVKDVLKSTKPKSKTKPSSSTLTRPTASLLARQKSQNKPLDIYSVQLLTRCQRSLRKFGDKLSPLLVSKLQNQNTKKQKLEAKMAHVCRKPKLTVPKEPNLRTAERSERHRSKVKAETEQNPKSSSNSSKRHTTNKNINLEPSSNALLKSNKPKSQDLEAFRLRTSLREKNHSSNAKLDIIQENDATNSRKLKPIDSLKSRKIICQVYESNICSLNSKRSNKELGEATKIKYGNNKSLCRADMKPFLDINRSLDFCRNFDSQEVAGNLISA